MIKLFAWSAAEFTTFRLLLRSETWEGKKQGEVYVKTKSENVASRQLILLFWPASETES